MRLVLKAPACQSSGKKEQEKGEEEQQDFTLGPILTLASDDACVNAAPERAPGSDIF